MNKITFPSICAPGQITNGLTLGEYSRGRRKDKPHQIYFGKGPWLVGNGVGAYTDTIERQDFNRLSDGDEAAALYYTALGLLLGAGHHKVRGVMVGLPVDVDTNETLKRSTMRGIGKILRGSHSFTLDDEEITIDVESITRVAQPVGAYTTWLMQQQTLPDGQIWGVLDGGFNTLDAFAVQYPRVIPKYTHAANLGMAEACREFALEFKRLTGRTISLHEADNYLLQKSPAVTFMNTGFVDLVQAKETALDSLASKVVQFIRDVWGEPLPFAGLIFAGGQFEALRKRVVSHYPGAFVLDDSVMSIATGLYYQSKMIKKWQGGLVIGLDPGFGAIKAVC